MAAPVERKVQAATAASAVSSLALWALSRYVFKGGDVPDVVTSWVYVIVASGVTFAAGYAARHTVLPGEPPAAPRYRKPAAGPPESTAPATRVTWPETAAPTSGTVQDRPEPSGAPAVTGDNAKAET